VVGYEFIDIFLQAAQEPIGRRIFLEGQMMGPWYRFQEGLQRHDGRGAMPALGFIGDAGCNTRVGACAMRVHADKMDPVHGGDPCKNTCNSCRKAPDYVVEMPGDVAFIAGGFRC